jgi:CRP-like cAMP-binding protein
MLKPLGSFPLFKDLSPADLEIIAPLFHRIVYPAGTVIFEQGQQAVNLYLLLEGEVVLRYKPYDSDAINLNNIHPGGVFGWSAVLGNPVYSSSVVCKTECETLVVRGADLRSLAPQYPETAQVIMNHLADAVSTRWENARAQVRSMVQKGIAENVSPMGKK